MIKYAITDPSFFNPYKSSVYIDNLDADFLLYRDKKNNNYIKDAKAFIELGKNYNLKKIIHSNYILAKELNAFGVHLTSLEFNNIIKAKELGLFVIISTHKLEEIKKARLLGADAVTFSPIFKTPNKGEAKGIKELKKAVKVANIKVIALGGIISTYHINLIKSTNAWGFASIRYFAYGYY